MTHYNIAVTVGPNIFRPKELKPSDLINAGTFYDIMIRMMTNFDEIFNNNEGVVTTEQIAVIRKKISEENFAAQTGLLTESQDMMAQCNKMMSGED